MGHVTRLSQAVRTILTIDSSLSVEYAVNAHFNHQDRTMPYFPVFVIFTANVGSLQVGELYCTI